MQLIVEILRLFRLCLATQSHLTVELTGGAISFNLHCIKLMRNTLPPLRSNELFDASAKAFNVFCEPAYTIRVL